jgi:predicted HTH transcriptional regulator
MEGQILDQKSIRYALGKHKNADGLACDCAGFANAAGGTILLGIEDGRDEPPANQRVADDFPERLRKRLAQITVNVGVTVRKVIAENGGEFVEIQVFRNEQSIAATSNGRYFIRVSDETRRLMPDDLRRWIGRLKASGVVRTRGRTKAMEYFIEPEVLRTLQFDGETTLKGIEQHRLRELILRDLQIYGRASISQIHNRIGKDIPRRKLRRELGTLVASGEISKHGTTRAAVYLWTK